MTSFLIEFKVLDFDLFPDKLSIFFLIKKSLHGVIMQESQLLLKYCPKKSFQISCFVVTGFVVTKVKAMLQ